MSNALYMVHGFDFVLKLTHPIETSELCCRQFIDNDPQW